MKLIVITQPEFFEDEAAAITSLFDAGLEILHLRKPGASYEDMDKLLRRLPAEYMERIVTHDHFGLASERNLKGVHLNRRNPAAPAGFTGHVSRSCHSLRKWRNIKRHATMFSSVPYTTAFQKRDMLLPTLLMICRRHIGRASSTPA